MDYHFGDPVRANKDLANGIRAGDRGTVQFDSPPNIVFVLVTFDGHAQAGPLVVVKSDVDPA